MSGNNDTKRIDERQRLLNEQLAKEINFLNKKIETDNQKYDQIQEKLIKQTTLNHQSAEKLKYAQRELSQLQNKIKTLEGENAQLKSDLAQAEDQLLELNEALSGIEQTNFDNKPDWLVSIGDGWHQFLGKARPLARKAYATSYQVIEKYRERLSDIEKLTPYIEWVKIVECTPICNGFHYVSDGTQIGVAIWQTSTRTFLKASGDINIEYWCYITGLNLPTETN